MRNIIAILKGTRGVFFDISNRNDFVNLDKDGNVFYIGIEEDRRNLRNDTIRFLSDFNASIRDAKCIWQ